MCMYILLEQWTICFYYSLKKILTILLKGTFLHLCCVFHLLYLFNFCCCAKYFSTSGAVPHIFEVSCTVSLLGKILVWLQCCNVVFQMYFDLTVLIEWTQFTYLRRKWRVVYRSTFINHTDMFPLPNLAPLVRQFL